jgi:hypothetical protein
MNPPILHTIMWSGMLAPGDPSRGLRDTCNNDYAIQLTLCVEPKIPLTRVKKHNTFRSAAGHRWPLLRPPAETVMAWCRGSERHHHRWRFAQRGRMQ